MVQSDDFIFSAACPLSAICIVVRLKIFPIDLDTRLYLDDPFLLDAVFPGIFD